MAALLNSLFFVFNISFLPKYHVKYFDYIVKWCGGMQCNWCASLDISEILALRFEEMVPTCWLSCLVIYLDVHGRMDDAGDKNGLIAVELARRLNRVCLPIRPV